MNKPTDKPPLSRTDKLCLVALAGALVATTLVYELTDGRAVRAAEVEAAQPLTIAISAPVIDWAPLIEAVEARQEAEQAVYYDEAIPLSWELQAVLRGACEDSGVPVALALGLIEVESNFQPGAISSEGHTACANSTPGGSPRTWTQPGTSAPGWPAWVRCWRSTTVTRRRRSQLTTPDGIPANEHMPAPYWRRRRNGGTDNGKI